MKKIFLKALAGAVLSVFCFMSIANVGADARTAKSTEEVSYEYYTVDYPGYYTTEPVVTYVPTPDSAVYDAYGNFLYYEEEPDTEVVTYQQVWHPGWTETKCRKVTKQYVPTPDLAVYDDYGNFLYYEAQPDTELVSYEEVW